MSSFFDAFDVGRNTEYIIVGGIVLAVIAGVVIGVYELTSPTAQACNNPASPCGAALVPLVAEFNQCAMNYNSGSATFLQEDSCAGAYNVAGCVPTAFTGAQTSYLKAQLDCMNTLAPQIAATAQKFNQNPLQTIATFLGEAVLIGVPAYLVIRAFARFRANRTTNAFTAYDWGGANFNATLEALVDVGEINSVNAGVWTNSVSGYNSANIANMNQALLQYTNLQLIDQFEQNQISLEQTDALNFDLDTLITALP